MVRNVEQKNGKRGKKVRAPRALKTKDDIYAGINWHTNGMSYPERRVYIGGSYYESSAQIHLTIKEVIRLSKWLNKAAEYFKSHGEK